MAKEKTSKKSSAAAPAVPSASKKSGPTICLCMIVRDEEKNLPDCLKSVEGIVDEIVIVDTGSKDQTKKIAKDHGAVVSDFKWIDDFSAARNFGIVKATKDWILIMDADDRLDEGAKKALKKELSKHTAEPALSVWVEDSEKGFRFTSLRLFQNFKNIHYVRPIHEQVYLGGLKDSFNHNEHKILNIKIEHTGIESGSRSKRNIKLLKKAIKMFPQDTELSYYLGSEYGAAGDIKKAIEQYLKAIDPYLDRDPAELSQKRFTMLPKIMIDLMLAFLKDKDPDGAYDVFLFGSSIFDSYGDLYYLAGTALQSKKEFEGAIDLFGKAAKDPLPPFNTYPATPNLKLLALRGTATSYYYLGDKEKAKKYYIEALKEDPEDLQSIHGLAYVLKEKLEPQPALKELAKHADLKNSILYAEAAKILHNIS